MLKKLLYSKMLILNIYCELFQRMCNNASMKYLHKILSLPFKATRKKVIQCLSFKAFLLSHKMHFHTKKNQQTMLESNIFCFFLIYHFSNYFCLFCYFFLIWKIKKFFLLHIFACIFFPYLSVF